MALPERKQERPRKRRVIRAQVKTKQINRKKEEEERIKKRRTSFLEKFINISLILTLVFGVGTTVYTYSKVSQINTQVRESRVVLDEMQAKKGFYTMGLEPFASPQYIENTARTSLGMDYPTSEQYLKIKKVGLANNLNDKNINNTKNKTAHKE